MGNKKPQKTLSWGNWLIYWGPELKKSLVDHIVPPVAHTISISVNETLFRVHPLANASGESADGGSHHRALYWISVKSSQQGSSQHSNAAPDDGALNGFFSHPAGLMGQTFTFIQILTDTVGSRIAIRINCWTVTAMGGAPGKNQSH